MACKLNLISRGFRNVFNVPNEELYSEMQSAPNQVPFFNYHHWIESSLIRMGRFNTANTDLATEPIQATGSNSTQAAGQPTITGGAPASRYCSLWNYLPVW